MRKRIVVAAVVAAGLLSGCRGKPRTFEEPGGQYTVLMPGSPAEDFVNTEPEGGRWLSLFAYRATGSGGYEYSVSHGRVEHTDEAGPPTSKELENVVIEYLKSAHGHSIDVNRKMTLGEFKGRHLLMTGGGAKTAVRMYWKVVPGNNFIYLMEMTFPPGEYVQADVDAFLDSFELGPEAGKPAGEIDQEKIPDWLKSK